MKKQERENKKDSATSINSRSLLGRGDLRGTLSHQSNTERGENTPFLQAGVFKHPAVGKGRLEGDGHSKNCKGGMGEGAGHYQEGHWGWAASHTCCFSLALLSEVAMFALFQCFSIF
jgi:hypothetical protein